MKDNDIVSKRFKTTELGALPEAWTVEALKNLNSEKKRSLNPAKFPDEVFEHYSIPAYQKFKRPVLEKGSRILSQKTILKNGAVLFGKLNPRVEKVWKVQSHKDSRKIGSTEWLPVFPDNKKVDSHYLYFVEWSKYVMPLSKTMVTGSTPSRQRVDPKSFYEIKIPLPPVPEQKKIAAVLSTVQETKKKTEAVIEATRELRRSLMKHLFTYGPVPVEEAENVPLWETEIGLIPKDWELVRLGEVFDMQQGKAMSPKSRLGISPRPFLRTVNVLWGRVDLSTLDHMDFTNEEITKLCLQHDDLLVCEGGKIGKTAIWREEIEVCGYQNHIHRLRRKRQDIWPEFYMYWMQAAFLIFDLYTGQGIRTTIPNLSSGRLKSFILPLPLLSVQQKIAKILSAVDKKIEVEENKRKTLEELFKTLLNNLMTAKIRVNHLRIGV